MQMAIELGSPGKHPVLWSQGRGSPCHPSHSVWPRNRQLESSQIHRPCAMGLLQMSTKATARRKEGSGKERREAKGEERKKKG